MTYVYFDCSWFLLNVNVNGIWLLMSYFVFL